MACAVEAVQGVEDRTAHQRLPLYFEPNRGQAAPGVDFLARTKGYGVFLNGSGVVLVLPSRFEVDAGKPASPAAGIATTLALLQLEFMGANPAAAVEAEGLLQGRSHYLSGNDPAGWRRNIPHFTDVRYRNVYPGVDVVWRGSDALEYDVVLKPGADPGVIRLAIKGHSSIRIDRDGGLNLELQGHRVVHRAPLVFQEVGGERKEIPARYRLLDDNLVGFELGAYDRELALTIDPLVLSYSTYVGGSASDDGTRIAVDAAGMAYMTGMTYSVDFPLAPNAPQGGILGTDDAYVVKIDPSKSGANSLVYATYLGSSDRDGGLGITVDSDGRAYVTGWSMGGDFPVTADAFKAT
ncbi:MAG TPA: SBBP repeat-containing protein, partial [Gammaproteobacteria bacterium]|nr:SBBP repeat-containing protein [Gammaproteobacteria bacterium]